MERLIRAMTTELQRSGIRAQAALPKQNMPLLRSPMTAVGLQTVQCDGAKQYLGIRNGQELYGKRIEATLQIDVYSPEAAGGSAAREAVSQVLDVLIGGLEDVEITQLSVQKCEYEPKSECFMGTILAQCRAFGYFVPSEDGSLLTDILLRGDLK